GRGRQRLTDDDVYIRAGSPVEFDRRLAAIARRLVREIPELRSHLLDDAQVRLEIRPCLQPDDDPPASTGLEPVPDGAATLRTRRVADVARGADRRPLERGGQRCDRRGTG